MTIGLSPKSRLGLAFPHRHHQKFQNEVQMIQNKFVNQHFNIMRLILILIMHRHGNGDGSHRPRSDGT